MDSVNQATRTTAAVAQAGIEVNAMEPSRLMYEILDPPYQEAQ